MIKPNDYMLDVVVISYLALVTFYVFTSTGMRCQLLCPWKVGLFSATPRVKNECDLNLIGLER